MPKFSNSFRLLYLQSKCLQPPSFPPTPCNIECSRHNFHFKGAMSVLESPWSLSQTFHSATTLDLFQVFHSHSSFTYISPEIQIIWSVVPLSKYSTAFWSFIVFWPLFYAPCRGEGLMPEGFDIVPVESFQINFIMPLYKYLKHLWVQWFMLYFQNYRQDNFKGNLDAEVIN